jgi:hypothetical protein
MYTLHNRHTWKKVRVLRLDQSQGSSGGRVRPHRKSNARTRAGERKWSRNVRSMDVCPHVAWSFATITGTFKGPAGSPKHVSRQATLNPPRISLRSSGDVFFSYCVYIDCFPSCFVWGVFGSIETLRLQHTAGGTILQTHYIKVRETGAGARHWRPVPLTIGYGECPTSGGALRYVSR